MNRLYLTSFSHGTRTLRRVGRVVCWAVLILNMAGCAETQQVRDVKTSGFLEDYSILRDGRENEAARVYINSEVDWASYDKILLDPITIWRPSKRSLEAHAAVQDLERLADFFYHALYQTLSQDYEMVYDPGPNTLRVQAALTSVDESWAMLDVMTAVPGARLFSRIHEYTTGKPLFVGEASIEFKVQDAQTPTLLFAGIDRRVGTKTIDSSAFDNWTDAEATLQFWAEQAKWRLCTLRGGVTCLKPEE